MRTTRRRDRLRYRFDNLMARGAFAPMLLLLVVWAAFILLLAMAVFVVGIWRNGDAELGFAEVTWQTMLRGFDSGTMAGDEGWRLRLPMLVVTLGGILLISTLIGLINNAIGSLLETLRKGRSLVVERGHTLVLGWSPQVFDVVGELVAARIGRNGPAILILADQDKVAMEDALRARLPRHPKTRIVCRRGSPIDPADLRMANLADVGSIIVLSPDTADPDALVIKTLLAIVKQPDRRAEPYHIVVDIHQPSSLQIVKMIARDEVQAVVAGDLISRITVQTCLQAGLSGVYADLLAFQGNEIYFHFEPALAGRTFGDALLAYEDSMLIGLRSADGTVRLVPPMDREILATDAVIVISADAGSVALARTPVSDVDEAAIRRAPTPAPTPRRTLLCGWNRRGAGILAGLDAYVPDGSTVTVLAEPRRAEAEVARVGAALAHQRAEFHPGRTTDRGVLEELDLNAYDHVIVLGAADELSPQEADARTLITLLHLRDLTDRRRCTFSLVGEMRDVRNRELAEVTQADDFIVSDRLVSQVLAQLAENPLLAPVFDELFDPRGVEFYLRPVEHYVVLGHEIAFSTVVAAARERQECAVGYRLRRQTQDTDWTHGVRLNPRKSDRVAFGPDDRIVVLAFGA